MGGEVARRRLLLYTGTRGKVVVCGLAHGAGGFPGLSTR
jgi:hypothetical protein